MIIDNAYSTTYGELISIAKIRLELTKYLATSDIDSLSYEYDNVDDVKLVFITGYNEDEKNIGMLEHPISMTDINGKAIVVADVRKYIKPVNEQPVYLSDDIRDANGFEFTILRTLLNRDVTVGDVGIHRPIFKDIISGATAWLSTAINSIVGLDPLELAHVEIVITQYLTVMMIESDEVDAMKGSINARVAKSKYTINMTNKIIMSILDKINYNVTSISDLIDNIKVTLPEEKSKLVSTDSLVSVISNNWYGPGNGETIIISLEHMPTLITLIYVNMVNKSYKRTRLASILDKSKKRIDAKVLEKHITNYLKSSIV